MYDANQYDKIKRYLGGITGSTFIAEKMATDVFTGYSAIGGWNPSSYAKAVLGKKIGFHISLHGSDLDVDLYSHDDVIKALEGRWSSGLCEVRNMIRNTCFRRMNAERDIEPEIINDEGLSETGKGASNLIRKYISESQYDESLIEKELLEMHRPRSK